MEAKNKYKDLKLLPYRTEESKQWQIDFFGANTSKEKSPIQKNKPDKTKTHGSVFGDWDVSWP